MATVSDILAAVNKIAPLKLALDWDNCGLLLGNPRRQVKKVLVCLDVTPQTVSEAKATGAQCVISHHPFTRDPMKRLTTETFAGRMAIELLEARIALIASHTNLDAAPGGLAEHLADLLGLTDCKPITPATGAAGCKLTTFVPEADIARMQKALFAAGAGCIGAYQECSFRTKGTGTFFASAGAKPAIGRKGRREEVAEYRLEVLVPKDLLPGVTEALKSAHSYEEPAFDIYPIEAPPAGLGIGRLGALQKKMSIRQLAQAFKKSVKAKAVQVAPAGPIGRAVRYVGVCSGSGSAEVTPAIAAGCEALLAGELKYHEVLEANAAGMAVVVAGHFETEKAGLKSFTKALSKILPKIKIVESRREGAVLLTM